jgi:hypothetical protein
VSEFFYGCIFVIIAQFMLMMLGAIFLRHLLQRIIDWCDRVKIAVEEAEAALAKTPNLATLAIDAETRRLLNEANTLLSDSRAIVAEGNEICKMAPKFRVLLARAEKGIEYVT